MEELIEKLDLDTGWNNHIKTRSAYTILDDGNKWDEFIGDGCYIELEKLFESHRPDVFIYINVKENLLN